MQHQGKRHVPSQRTFPGVWGEAGVAAALGGTLPLACFEGVEEGRICAAPVGKG